MECFHRRISYASWRLDVFRQLFLTSPPAYSPKFSPHRKISTTQNLTQQQSHNEQNASGQIDKSKGPTGESPRPSQLLPQSPLLTRPLPGHDKKRKQRPTKEDTDRLRLNPWAVALSSPPRMCSVTGTRVPKAFLGDWGMVERPGSDGLWFMPVGLLKDELSASSANDSETALSSISNEKNTKNRPLRLLTLRIIDRLPLLKELTKSLSRQGGGKKPRILRLIPFRWKHPLGPITSRDEKRIIWREDMSDFLLGRMRRDVLKQLKKTCDGSGQLDLKSGGWKSIKSGGQSEAALLEGLKGMEPFERMECSGVLVMDSPTTLPDFVTLPQVQSKVPVFDCSLLFSESDLKELRSYDPRFESTALFLSPDDPTAVQALLDLWKLKGFLRPNAA